MWGTLRMNKGVGGGLLSRYLFYFDPTENPSSVFIERVALASAVPMDSV